MDVMQSTLSTSTTPSALTSIPSALAPRKLKPVNSLGSLFVGLALATTALGLILSSDDFISLWLIGQLILAIAFLQWFVLLHEAGHNNLFRTQRLNRLAGWTAGFMALIPFGCWKLVHGMHHRWTGWQDLDMTTATLTPRAL